jgi:PA14 domain
MTTARILTVLGFLFGVGAGLAVAAPVEERRPLALHPDNPRYFLFRGEPTVLVTSGEHYGAVLNLDFDFVRYLATLAADGLNLTRTFSGVYREVPGSFGITDNTLAPRRGRFISPWARTTTPGDFDGLGRFDLERWNETYFARLRDFLAEAHKRGVVVELNLFCPFYEEEMWKASPMNADNNVGGVGDVPREEVYTLRHPRLTAVQEAVTRRIVTELNAFDNLYFEIANEPYFGGITLEWQRHIAKVIADTEASLPRKHLVSRNVANGAERVDEPSPLVSIFNFHYATPPDAVGMNAHVRGVIGENETGFRGRDDVLYRSEGWAFVLAGGGLYNNLDYSFTTAHPDGTFLEYTSPGGGSPSLRRQLGVLSRFVHGFDFVRMAPDAGVLVDVPESLRGYVLAEPGRQYAVYLHAPTGSPGFAARWTGRIDPPQTGTYRLRTVSDDGVRLWVGGRLVVDNWTNHGATEDEASVELAAGRPVDVRLEYYQGSGGAVIRLRWTRPDGATETLPPTVLRPPGGEGAGLRGEYFASRDFEGGAGLDRLDPAIDFEWAAGVSPLPAGPRWTGSARLGLDLPAGRYAGEWILPRTGETLPAAEIAHEGGRCVLTSPPFEEDVALALRSR